MMNKNGRTDKGAGMKKSKKSNHINYPDNFEKLLSDILKEENAPEGNIQMLKTAVYPEIRAKSLQLEKRHRQRKENGLLVLVYIVFTFLSLFLLWNYITFGFSPVIALILKIIGVGSAMLLLCLPLLYKFKFNISQRGEY